MNTTVILLIIALIFGLWLCWGKSESYGRGGPELDFLPTIGEYPAGEGGYLDEEDIPF